MNRNRWIPVLAAVSLLAAGCGKQVPDEYRQMDEETRLERKYVNTFAWNVMDTYYLWREEISPAMDKWEIWEEPIQKVADIRYKDAAGEDIDRWTMLTDDFAGLTGNVSGHTRTFGMDFQLYYADQAKTRICAVVTYTCASSPAELAGLGRGDVILTVDGLKMTPDNYQDVVRERLLGDGTVKLGLSDGRTVTVTAVDMYEDPVQTVRILERPGGKKVGYLHYTSFTLDSCEDLTDVFRRFREAGIDELVLDLRYNGGGYVMAEKVLASMLAPAADVEAGSVFYQEVYNAELAKELNAEPACFETEFVFRSGGALQIVSTAGANPDLPRLYVLVTRSSASASESLVCGLRPYMDVILIGERTSGKYCAGYLVSADAWYDAVKENLEEGEYGKALPYVDNWGIYVMYSRYADCNGVTLSMPDGIAPDVGAEDDPLDGFALGDPRETMLSVALGLIEGRTRSAAETPARRLAPVPGMPRRAGTGLLVGEGPVR
jgi:C-terminal processing protease CtpA/Prc